MTRNHLRAKNVEKASVGISTSKKHIRKLHENKTQMGKSNNEH